MALVTPLSPTQAATRPAEPLGARVIWQRAAQIYLVADDSSAVVPGDTLFVKSGKKLIATASVVDVARGGLVVASLVSGTLARERKLARLRVTVGRLPLPTPTTLRVGIPSNRRAIIAFGCGPWTLRPPAGVGYRVESTGRLGFRMTRDSSADSVGSSPARIPAAAPTASWPDTIVMALFDDAAEEEIALERGDLDVALFGPGEVSARLREAPRWKPHLFADGGYLAESAADSSVATGMAIRRISYPVLTTPELGRYVRALGPSEFLRMLDCGAHRRGMP